MARDPYPWACSLLQPQVSQQQPRAPPQHAFDETHPNSFYSGGAEDLASPLMPAESSHTKGNEQALQAVVKNTFIEAVDVDKSSGVRRSSSESDLSRSSAEEKMQFWLPSLSSERSSSGSGATRDKIQLNGVPFQQWQSYVTGRLPDQGPVQGFDLSPEHRLFTSSSSCGTEGQSSVLSSVHSRAPQRPDWRLAGTASSAAPSGAGSGMRPMRADVPALPSQQPFGNSQLRPQGASASSAAPQRLGPGDGVAGMSRQGPDADRPWEAVPTTSPPLPSKLAGMAPPLRAGPDASSGFGAGARGSAATGLYQSPEPEATDANGQGQQRQKDDQIVKAQLAMTQKNERGEYGSVGSQKHATGECSPCLFWFRQSCVKGVNCDYCHFRHKGQRNKRIRPSKKTRMQMRATQGQPGPEEDGFEDADDEDAEGDGQQGGPPEAAALHWL